MKFFDITQNIVREGSILKEFVVFVTDKLTFKSRKFN